MSKTHYTAVTCKASPGNGVVGLGFSQRAGSGNLVDAWEDSDVAGWIFMKVRKGGAIVVVRTPHSNVSGVVCLADNPTLDPNAPPPVEGPPGEAEIARIKAKRDAALAAKAAEVKAAAKPKRQRGAKAPEAAA
jgi:hypothetical protein